jgi:hypothetical protein
VRLCDNPSGKVGKSQRSRCTRKDSLDMAAVCGNSRAGCSPGGGADAGGQEDVLECDGDPGECVHFTSGNPLVRSFGVVQGLLRGNGYKSADIAFDRIGLEIFTPTDVIVKNVAELCKQGYAKQIMLSHDTVNVWLGRQIDAPEQVLKALANWRIDHISQNVLPALKAQGVTDEQIKTMMVDNPRNLFLGK